MFDFLANNPAFQKLQRTNQVATQLYQLGDDIWKIFGYEFEKTRNTLLLVGFLSFAFITGQLLVWQHFINIGQYASTNPANAFFYLFTALHGLHLLGGLFFWGRATTSLFKNNFSVVKIKQAIELCAIYWHFLLIVWFILFALMIAS